MKKLAIFFILLTVVFSSCAKKERDVKEPEDDFLKIPEYVTEVPKTSNYGDGNSYWFVLVEEKDGTMKMNTFVKQNHKYFSTSEAKAEFKKDVFILDFIEVSKETYENNQ
jgi:hypothetical protein